MEGRRERRDFKAKGRDAGKSKRKKAKKRQEKREGKKGSKELSKRKQQEKRKRKNQKNKKRKHEKREKKQSDVHSGLSAAVGRSHSIYKRRGREESLHFNLASDACAQPEEGTIQPKRSYSHASALKSVFVCCFSLLFQFVIFGGDFF